MKKDKIVKLFEILKNNNPNPKTELNYTNSFTLLVAVVLSAQSTDKGVNRVTDSLFKIVTTPEDILSLGLEKLESLINTIGLYKTKAKNLVRLSKILVERYNSAIPSTLEDLESLPGVGRKTANVVLNVAFDQETIPVDTHVFRVSNRTGLAKGKTPLEVEEKLKKCIPKPFKKFAHHWLILHGRYICTARKPACERCPINELCAYDQKIFS